MGDLYRGKIDAEEKNYLAEHSKPTFNGFNIVFSTLCHSQECKPKKAQQVN